MGRRNGAPESGGLYYHVVSSANDPRYTHPTTDAQSSANFDVGVIVTKEAFSVTPVPLRRPPVGAEVIGQSARFVGYGFTSPTDTTDRIRREATIPATSIIGESLVFANTTYGSCRGDSGGPILLAGTDGETLAAVVSTGDAACAEWSAGAILDDQALDFIDEQVATADPQPDMAVVPDLAADPSTMGGAQGCSFGGHPTGSHVFFVGVALALLCYRRRLT